MDLSNHDNNRTSPGSGWDAQGGWTGEETSSAGASAQNTESAAQGAGFSSQDPQGAAQDPGSRPEDIGNGYSYYRTDQGSDYGPHPSYTDPNPGSYSYTSYGTGNGNAYGTGGAYGAGSGTTYGTGNGSAYGTGGAYGAGNGNAYGTSGAYGAGSGSTYGAGFSGGNDGGNGGGPEDPAGGRRRGRKRRERKPHAPRVLTVRAFVISLILCMVATSALTFGGMLLYQKNHTDSGSYTLTESTESLSYSSIVKMNEDSVVSITTESVSTDTWARNYVTEGAGSGVIISSDGYILTCSHVVEDASKITVTTSDSKDYEATVVGMDTSQEVAVLKIDAKGLNAVDYGDSDELTVGDQVICIGNPLGKLGGTVTQGIISSLNRSITIDNKTLTLLQTDASVNPGNSGGGLFNSKGELIGIIVAKSVRDSSGTSIEGIGFAIPINTAKSIANDLIENGGSGSSVNSAAKKAENIVDSSQSGDSGSTTSQTPTIGVIVSQMSASKAQSAGYSEGEGLYIVRVTSTTAQSAGLRQGDKITAIDGSSISGYSDLRSRLSEHSAGDKVQLTISRNGASKTIPVQLQ